MHKNTCKISKGWGMCPPSPLRMPAGAHETCSLTNVCLFRTHVYWANTAGSLPARNLDSVELAACQNVTLTAAADDT